MRRQAGINKIKIRGDRVAHDKNYYASEFHKYSIHRTEKGIRIDINFQPLGAALDRAQLALDNQVWDDMKRHIPRRDGELIRV